MLLILLLISGTANSISDWFEVVCPAGPVSAVTGKNAILPCSLKPNVSVVDFRVEWFRVDLKDSQIVHLYKDHMDKNTSQTESYRGRTKLNHQELQRGDASLRLSSVRVSDEGLYKCFIESRSWYDDCTVNVTIEAVGSTPVITVNRFDRSGGLHLQCESKGWYPEPDIEWLDRKGVRLSPETIQKHRDTDRFSVKHTITVHPRNGTVYCRVNGRSHMLETAINISNEVFNSQRMLVILIACVAMLGAIAIVLMALCIRKNTAHNQLQDEYGHLQLAYNRVQKENRHLHYEETRLQYERNQLSQGLKTVAPKALTHLRTHSVDVILDAATAHPRLMVSEDGKQVREGRRRQEAVDGDEHRFNDYRAVFGKEGFIAGCFYFEVQVKDQTKWYLGVAGESVISQGLARLCSGNGYWTVSLYSGKHRARGAQYVLIPLTDPPQRIGVFVDYEEGLISFYDVGSSSHIYSFTNQSFNEKLYPFVCLGRYSNKNTTPLIICDDY